MPSPSLSEIKQQGTLFLKYGNFMGTVGLLAVNLSPTSDSLRHLHNYIVLYETYLEQERTGTLPPGFKQPMELGVLVGGLKRLLDSLTDEDLEKDDYPVASLQV